MSGAPNPTAPAPTPAAPSPSDASANADTLIDRFLEDSLPDEDEQPTPKPRKPAKPDEPEDEAPEDDEELSDEDLDGVEEEDTGDEDDTGAEDDDDQSEKGRFVAGNGRVKMPDGSTTTVAELVRGNLRQADYTRKTQETGALHQALQARAADYAQQEQIVSLAIDIMAAALPPEPDMSLLEPGDRNDPIGFTNQKLRWEAASQQLQAMQIAKQQMAERNAQIQGTLMQRYALEQKDKLLQYKPELTDRKKLDAYHAGLVKTLSRYGKTAADLDTIYDADIIRMLEHLGNYHQILAARKSAKRKVQGAPVMAPNTRPSPGGQKARTRKGDWATLGKTGGKGANGEAALDRLLDDLL